MLSYRSTLGQSLKQISLWATPLEAILNNIAIYRSSYIDVLVQENLIGSRFKSEDSILRKYEKTLRTGGGFRHCFNDVLGFRLRFEEYPDTFPGYFCLVDLQNGKKNDDGYRVIHRYYSGIIWPIRLRFSFGSGRTIFSISGATGTYTNIWLRKPDKNYTRNTAMD